MGQHMGGRIAPLHQFAVIPDDAITIGHRHLASSSEFDIAR
jgi:hypothetical protein